jgi:RNA polymerase sigma-70 factor (ECF subfamily)
MQTDDGAWLAELFEANSRAVRAFVFRRVPAEAVDDIVAEVFTVAWRNRARVPRDGRTVPWLYRTAVNLIGHHHRTTGRRRVHDLRGSGVDTTPDATEGVADQVVISRALGLLAPADAEVLRLAYWEDLPTRDLAFVLGCTDGAARVRLHRARRHLRELLEDTDDIPRPARSMTGEEHHDHA